MIIPSQAHDALAAPLDTTICAVCELSGGPFAPQEAAYLVGLHNSLHHGGSAAPSLRS